MTKYIELEALKNRFAKRLVWLKKDIHDEYSLGLHDGCEYDTKLIDEIPAADVAPVVHGRWEKQIAVRCRECKHCDPENYHCDHPMGTAAPLRRKPDDFCSYGERKGCAGNDT